MAVMVRWAQWAFFNADTTSSRPSATTSWVGGGLQSSLCSSIFCILFFRHWGGNKLSEDVSEASTRADPCTDSSVIKLSGYLPAQVSAVRGTFCSSKLWLCFSFCESDAMLQRTLPEAVHSQPVIVRRRTAALILDPQ